MHQHKQPVPPARSNTYRMLSFRAVRSILLATVLSSFSGRRSSVVSPVVATASHIIGSIGPAFVSASSSSSSLSPNFRGSSGRQAPVAGRSAGEITSVVGVRRCLDNRNNKDTTGRKATEIMAINSDTAGNAKDSGCVTTSNTPNIISDTKPDADSSSSKQPPAPPIPRRNESDFILAGMLSPAQFEELGIDPELPRQANDSPYPLLDPPRRVPNPYGWMRSDDRSSKDVLDHLKEENKYTEAVTGHLTQEGGLRDVLYKELVGGLQETDYTTPGKDGKWWYYRRTYEGKAYPVHCRAPVAEGSEDPLKVGKVTHPSVSWDHKGENSKEMPILPGEVVYLDENELAKGKDYCSTGSVTESPSHKLLAYTVDFTGGETYELHVKDIESGEEVDYVEGLECDRTVRWGNDDQTIFYLKMDAQHRPYQVYRRKIGTDAKDDEMLFEELDDLYWVGISKSADKKYLFVETSSSETSEMYYLDLTDPEATLKCIAKRRKKVLYDVEHRDGQWLITTNYSGETGDDGNNKPTSNFRLMRCRAIENSQDHWQDMRDGLYDVMFDGSEHRALDHVQPFWRHAVAIGREGGVPRVWIIRFGEEECNLDVIDFIRLDFTEESYDVGLGPNYNYMATELVLSYDSLITPLESILVDMDEPDDIEGRVVLKQKNVPGYDKSKYACDRVTVMSRDGKTKIPVSLVYRADVMEQHVASGNTLPVHLYGYGSYGSNVEDDFGSTRLPLLNRGMVYVLAHIRGGGEMGRQWYEEPNGAKFLCKKNTFDDFVDVARWLVEDKKLTTPKQMSCEGRSAGGLLIGASVNQAPNLFGVAILGVPFVDVVPTMIDASIPLTAGEWEEWGNPNEEKFFDYMMSYCPMHNVKEGAKYPSMLLTGGLHDPRVQYWEPTKFSAVLRHNQGKESGLVCLKIDMTAGHFSASDRYKYLKELSFDYAFLLDQLGLAGEG